MPLRPARPCSNPTCWRTKPCPRHDAPQYGGSGSNWQATVRRIIARDGGLCTLKLEGCTRIAVTADHIVSRTAALAQGWTQQRADADSNLRAACKACNHKAEGLARRGLGPTQQPASLTRRVASTAERISIPLVGRAKTKQALDAAALVMAGESGDWRTQEIPAPNGELYMRRHFLTSRYEHPQIWVHEILLPDADRWLHDHPWDYKTVLLNGSYNEETDEGITDYSEGDTLSRKAESLHRLHLASPVVTLFVTARMRRQWGFATPDGWVESSVYLGGGGSKIWRGQPQPECSSHDFAAYGFRSAD